MKKTIILKNMKISGIIWIIEGLVVIALVIAKYGFSLF